MWIICVYVVYGLFSIDHNRASVALLFVRFVCYFCGLSRAGGASFFGFLAPSRWRRECVPPICVLSTLIDASLV